MHLKSILALLLLAGMALPAAAQTDAAHYCAAAKRNRHPVTANKGTIADAGENNYDVKYVKLDVSMTNAASSISGSALTNAVTSVPMSEYVTELTNDLTIDSVRVNGIRRTFTHANEVVKASLATPVPANTAFNAQIYYHGTVPSGSAFFDRGLRRVYSGAGQRYYTFTLGEPYGARDWWPCKQALQDKIDSSDVWITVPDTLKAGSNGLLERVTPVFGSRARYEWKSRNPIDYYLISASVGRYDEYAYYMHFSNSTDSMLLQHYIYPGTLVVRRPVLDSTALMINYFSDLFTRYPFYKEKYGHCQAPLGGGEEHQTMTTIGVWDGEVVPHELCHQWFGDHVTCGTWKDLWLNEGFASYAEYLHVAHFRGAVAARNKLLTVHHDAMYEPFSAMPDPSGSVYVDDTLDENRLFSSRLTYNKASAIIHTLRFEAHNDTLFFNTLRLYQQQFADSTATTEQFKELVARQYGRNMDTFFNQWIYATGWPVFNVTWNQKNGVVLFSLDQTATGNYTAHKYSTPLELSFSSPQGDTTVRIQTNDNATTFAFSWNKTATGVTVDPNNWLLDGPGTITRDNSLRVAPVAQSTATLYPNPARHTVTVSGPAVTELQILDLTGRCLIRTALGGNRETDISMLASGIYLYRILQQDQVTGQGKLVKE